MERYYIFTGALGSGKSSTGEMATAKKNDNVGSEFIKFHKTQSSRGVKLIQIPSNPILQGLWDGWDRGGGCTYYIPTGALGSGDSSTAETASAKNGDNVGSEFVQIPQNAIFQGGVIYSDSIKPNLAGVMGWLG